MSSSSFQIIDQVVMPDDYEYAFNDFEKLDFPNEVTYDGLCSFTYLNGQEHDENVSLFRSRVLVNTGYVLIDINSPKDSNRTIETWIGRSRLKDF